MKLIGESFSRNGAGTFKGVVKAYSDDGKYLNFRRRVDLNAPKEVEAMIAALSKRLALPLDEARSLYAELDEQLEAQEKLAEDLPDEEGSKKSQATTLVDLALGAGAELWHTPDDTCYATMDSDGHRETWPTHSKAFRQWLSYLYYGQEGKTPGTQATYDALQTLDGKAKYEGAEHQVYIRVAEVDGSIYLDLCNDEWEAVKVTPEGWEVVSDPPVRFRRSKGMLPLPTPERGGSVQPLRDLLNLPKDDDTDWCLFLACLVQAFRGRGPYPVLAVHGEHGSAKSTATRVYKRMVDPNMADTRTTPRDERDLMVQAGNGWVLAYDNLSGLPQWLSDALCRISTGGGMSTRELYSDSEEHIFAAMRPIIVNGIKDIADRPDLLDRLVDITLEAIAKDARMSESDFWAAFDDVHGQVLGGLLDAAVVGLQRLPDVRLAELPRMADFAIWATACETGLGFRPGTFQAAYARNRASSTAAGLAAYPIGQYLLQIMESRDEWKGTFTDLLDELERLATDRDKKDKLWPSRPNVLSGQVRTLAPSLRDSEIEAELGREKNRRYVRLIKIDPPFTEKDGKSASSASPRHPSYEAQAGADDDGGDDDDADQRPGDGHDDGRVTVEGPQKPPNRSWVNDDDGDDDGSAGNSILGGSKNQCESCRQTVPAAEVYEYLSNGGVLCLDCAP